jgi:hypothetical protein
MEGMPSPPPTGPQPDEAATFETPTATEPLTVDEADALLRARENKRWRAGWNIGAVISDSCAGLSGTGCVVISLVVGVAVLDMRRRGRSS